MTKLTALDLNPFYRNAIGVDKLFDRIIHQIDSATTTNYPPYNILKTGEATFEVQVAVAGFAPGEVAVSVEDGTLIISGEKLDATLPAEVEYYHQGISARRFIRTFQMVDGVEVKGAVSKDGILTVKLEQIVPEAKKPKAIAINYES
jgi:molecular chaperone IbpA